jgi:hypothetical protein
MGKIKQKNGRVEWPVVVSQQANARGAIVLAISTSADDKKKVTNLEANTWSGRRQERDLTGHQGA